MQIISVSGHICTEFNATNSWREKIGMALHLLGRLVDGREILAIKIDAAPALSREQMCEVLQSGADAISRGAYELVHINGVEVACKTAMPALWRESPSPDKETLCNSTKRS